jgi:tetratricopeptide (TPR) repeat protein
MKRWAFAAVFLLTHAAFGQRHKLGTVNAETPEGALLQQIGQESDAAKKTALMEEFATKFQKHEGTGWVLQQLLGAYSKGNQFDKTIETGEKLLALDPDDVETAHQNLKAAEGKKDLDGIVKWSGRTAEIAPRVSASPQPKDEEEVEFWKHRVDFAKQVVAYTEYSLYNAALTSQDGRKKIQLLETLQQRNPKNAYAAGIPAMIFTTYRQLGDNEKAVATAEQILATDQSSEDMLLLVAFHYLQKNQQPEKVLTYSAKLVEVMASKPKPDGIAEADWTARKNQLTGLGHYMVGSVQMTQSKFAPADETLRKALPLVESNADMKAETLFNLALANFKLGESTKNTQRILDAIKYNEQCAAIKSRFQAKAAQNLKVIRAQYRVTK